MVAMSGGKAFSVERMVRADERGVASSDVNRPIAGVLTSEDMTLCYDASDRHREAYYRLVRKFLPRSGPARGAAGGPGPDRCGETNGSASRPAATETRRQVGWDEVTEFHPIRMAAVRIG